MKEQKRLEPDGLIKIQPPSFGDVVTVKPDAPSRYRPRECGSVFSIFRCETEELSVYSGADIGELSIGVEFEDGSGIEIPLKWLDISPTLAGSSVQE